MADPKMRFEDETVFFSIAYYDKRARAMLAATEVHAVESDRAKFYRLNGIVGIGNDGQFFHVGDPKPDVAPIAPDPAKLLQTLGAADDPNAGAKARFAAYLESLTAGEFLFQAQRAGFFGIGSGISPDPTSIYSGLFVDEIQRRISLQQITPQGTLVQPIGPITTLPVVPPGRTVPPGFGVPPGGIGTPGTGVGKAPPIGTVPILPALPGIGVPPGTIPAPSDGRRPPVRPVGPGLGDVITIGDGIASGTAKAVDKRGNNQVPPGALRPPGGGSAGTGQPPGFGQGFPDNLFARNPPDP